MGNGYTGEPSRSPNISKRGNIILLDFWDNKEINAMSFKLKVTSNFGSKVHHFPSLDGEGDSEYFVKIREVTQGDIAAYRNLGKSIRYVPIQNERFAQEQEFPQGDLMYARAEICVSEWNLDAVDDKGKTFTVPFSRSAWDQLPPEWANWLDDIITDENPELIGGTKNRRKTSSEDSSTTG